MDRRRPLLFVLCACFSSIALDNTKLVAALPTLAREYGTQPTALKWVVEANLLVYASLLLLGGALSERFGPRRMLLLGLSIFAAGSLLAARASTPAELILMRAVMGLGGALLTPATLATIRHTFSESERAGAVAFFTASFGVGATAGPLLAGFLLASFGTGSIMLANVPLAALCLAGAFAFVPRDLPKRAVPLDLGSSALAFAATAALVFAILEAPERGYATPAIIGALAASALLYAGLFAWQRRAPHPLFEPLLFREPRFTATLLVILLGYLSFSGVSFVVAQYLQIARAYPPLEAGLLCVPLTTSMLVGTLLGPLGTVRFGAERAIVAGLLLACGGASLLALSSLQGSELLLCAAEVAFGAGAGSVFSNATELVLGVVPPERAGTAAGISETAFEVGGVLGIALLSATLGAAGSSAEQFARGATHAFAVGALSMALAVWVALGLARKRRVAAALG